MDYANYAMNLDGPNNLRDLGGYPTVDGRRTRWRQFLRSDNPASLTPYDCDTLYQYGVRLQVDLRSVGECQRHPSPLEAYPGIDYCNLPLLDNMNSNQGEAPLPENMASLYTQMLDQDGDTFLRMFRLVLEYPEDCVLFNCTAGKDRTGVAAMLLLKCARCADPVVVADYAASYGNIRRQVEETLKEYQDYGLTVDHALFRSEALEMERTLAYLEETEGSAEAWMIKWGMTPTEVEALRRKLVG